MGIASSAARSRACARCCGGPQSPNHASFDGLNRKRGRLCAVEHLPGKDDLVADLAADLTDTRHVQAARPGARPEIDVAGYKPRQADSRQHRAHRQIFAIRHEMRLAVAPADAATRVHREQGIARARPSRRARRSANRRRTRWCRAGPAAWRCDGVPKAAVRDTRAPPLRATGSGGATDRAGRSVPRACRN